MTKVNMAILLFKTLFNTGVQRIFTKATQINIYVAFVVN
jgi:hypothetical protein